MPFQINEITVMLYQKIEENSLLQQKVQEQQQVQSQQIALQQLLALS